MCGKTHRLINSRYPPIDVFEGLYTNETERRIAFILEQATSPRVVGRLDALPLGSLPMSASNDGASYVAAAFIYTSETGGRFNSAKLGAWYAAFDIETAIAETLHHNTRRLEASAAGFPNRIQLRELIVTVSVDALDLRGAQAVRPELYHPTDYARSQAFADDIRWPYAQPGEDALVYDSVRNAGGANLCVFRPQAVPLPVLQGEHLEYHWDADGVARVLKLTKLR